MTTADTVRITGVPQSTLWHWRTEGHITRQPVTVGFFLIGEFRTDEDEGWTAEQLVRILVLRECSQAHGGGILECCLAKAADRDGVTYVQATERICITLEQWAVLRPEIVGGRAADGTGRLVSA